MIKVEHSNVTYIKIVDRTIIVCQLKTLAMLLLITLVSDILCSIVEFIQLASSVKTEKTTHDSANQITGNR